MDQHPIFDPHCLCTSVASNNQQEKTNQKKSCPSPPDTNVLQVIISGTRNSHGVDGAGEDGRMRTARATQFWGLGQRKAPAARSRLKNLATDGVN
jgi:hypothetical protein